MNAVTGIPPRPPGKEGRRSQRERVIRRVQMMAGGRCVDAVMLDVSEHGARLQMSQPGFMPAIFTLRRHDGSATQVVQRWAQNGCMGVEFVPEAKAPTVSGRREVTAVRDHLAAATEALRVLGRAANFGDEEVRGAGRDLGASIDRLLRALDRLPKKYADC